MPSAVRKAKDTGQLRAARVLTEVLSPAPVVGVLVVLVAIHSTRTPEQAVVTGIVAACFGSLLPLGYVLYQVRRRRLDDVHVGVRSQRPLVLLVALASVLVVWGCCSGWERPDSCWGS